MFYTLSDKRSKQGIELNQCFYCGKAVQDEDLVMKNVQLSGRESRNAFHKECWNNYHSKDTKKTLINYGGLLLACVGVLVTAYLAFLYEEIFSGSRIVLPLITLSFTVGSLVYLAIIHRRLDK